MSSEPRTPYYLIDKQKLLANMRTIDVTLFGETGMPISAAYGGPQIASDSIIARIRLRNEY